MTDPNGPPVPAVDLRQFAALRRRAARRLTTDGGSGEAAHALAVLHAMATSADTAADALTLLHELQVHQIELDLQSQELHDALAQAEGALSRQAARYDQLPLACLTVDAELLVRELNRQAARLLGVEPARALGLPLAAFLSAASLQDLRACAARVDAGQRRAACTLDLQPRNGPRCTVQAQLTADPAARGYLLGLAEGRPDAQPSPA